jgi:hypothetical protein
MLIGSLPCHKSSVRYEEARSRLTIHARKNSMHNHRLWMQACPRKVPVSGRLTKSPSDLGSTESVLAQTGVARLF